MCVCVCVCVRVEREASTLLSSGVGNVSVVSSLSLSTRPSDRPRQNFNNFTNIDRIDLKVAAKDAQGILHSESTRILVDRPLGKKSWPI